MLLKTDDCTLAIQIAHVRKQIKKYKVKEANGLPTDSFGNDMDPYLPQYEAHLKRLLEKIPIRESELKYELCKFKKMKEERLANLLDEIKCVEQDIECIQANIDDYDEKSALNTIKHFRVY